MKRTKIKRSFTLQLKQKRKKHWWNRMPVFRLNILAVVLVFGFIVANLVVLNTITANGYKIKKVENNFLELKNQNQNLSLDLSDKQAIDSVMKKLGHMDMTEAKNVSYITMPDTIVARK